MQQTLSNPFATDTTTQRNGVLRFITAGSVDDGKSTLIGRLLHDSGAVFDDQMQELRRSRGHMPGEVGDLSLLTDGLRSEREQGITIDVAYRYFSSPRRKFIVIDAPGHVQYTRNMVTGASGAEVAVIVVDVRRGLVEQTRRHAFLASLLGVQQIVFAVNKMDLVDFDQSAFASTARNLSRWAQGLQVPHTRCIPVSALSGDNVVTPSKAMPWYDGPSLLQHLEEIDTRPPATTGGFRMAVQWVIHSGGGGSKRSYAGVPSGGAILPGSEVIVLPSGVRTRISQVRTYDGPLQAAHPGQSVTVELADDADVSRGDMLCSTDSPPRVSDRLEAVVAWMGSKRLHVGGRYSLKQTTRWVTARVTRLVCAMDVNDLGQDEGIETLEANGIGRLRLETSAPLAFDPYTVDPATGSFILVDEQTHETVAAGMLTGTAEQATGAADTFGMVVVGTAPGSGTRTATTALQAALAQSPRGATVREAIALDAQLPRVIPRPGGEPPLTLVACPEGWRAPLPTGGKPSGLARSFHLGVCMVVGAERGCLNHARLTAEAIGADGLPLLGWVVNCTGPLTASVRAELRALERSLQAPCLGTLPHQPEASDADRAAALDLGRVQGLWSGAARS